MQIKITRDFSFAHRGIDVRRYVAGTVMDADDIELVEVAIEQGWAVAAQHDIVSFFRAPEDRDAAPLRKTKRLARTPKTKD